MDEDKRQLQCLLDAYEWVRRTINDADKEIERILPEVPCADLVLSIGANPSSTGVILAFAGDLRNLKDGSQLLRKAGLNLAERSSGKDKGKVKITKRGNSLLRKHLYLTVTHLLSYQSVPRVACRECSSQTNDKDAVDYEADWKTGKNACRYGARRSTMY